MATGEQVAKKTDKAQASPAPAGDIPPAIAGKYPQGVHRLDNKGLEESKVIPPASPVPGRYHVDLYLKAKGIPLHHRGGRKAFAVAKKKEFATDQEFHDLFKLY